MEGTKFDIHTEIKVNKRPKLLFCKTTSELNIIHKSSWTLSSDNAFSARALEVMSSFQLLVYDLQSMSACNSCCWKGEI